MPIQRTESDDVRPPELVPVLTPGGARRVLTILDPRDEVVFRGLRPTQEVPRSAAAEERRGAAVVGVRDVEPLLAGVDKPAGEASLGDALQDPLPDAPADLGGGRQVEPHVGDARRQERHARLE